MSHTEENKQQDTDEEDGHDDDAERGRVHAQLEWEWTLRARYCSSSILVIQWAQGKRKAANVDSQAIRAEETP